MEKIKPPAVAGKFYTSDKLELLSQIEQFKKNNKKDYTIETRGVIVPHAGYYYSGQIASEGLQYLDKNVENVFIIAPAHYVGIQGLGLSTYDKWSTPLGEIELNKKINDELKDLFGCLYVDEAFVSEHAVEVQVPFIQTLLPHVKIVPILVGNYDYKKITQIIDHYWKDKKNAFVISSDLSHFYHSHEARKLDELTACMIESNQIENFDHQQACNSAGVCAITNFARERNFSLIRIDMKNSGDITGETASVVGYGSWLIYEGEKTEFLKKHFSNVAIDICRNSILAGLYHNRLPNLEEFKTIPEVFKQYGACFVTLEKNGELRGCIGSIIAHEPLIDDLLKNAYKSAFSDTRFSPLQVNEYKELSISVSLLSEPAKMSFENEADLLSQIVPGYDGIIIKDGPHQAVYLPSVWEQLPEKEMFLDSLKIKAGLPPKHFSKHFEAYRFKTEYIKG